MAFKTAMVLPRVGEWFNRKNGSRGKPRKDFREVDQIKVEAVDGKKEDITIARLDGFEPDGAPRLGRRATVSFKAWTKSGHNKFTKIDPPQPQPQTSHAEPAAEASADNMKLESLEGMLREHGSMLRRLLSIAENGPLFAAKAS